MPLVYGILVPAEAKGAPQLHLNVLGDGNEEKTKSARTRYDDGQDMVDTITTPSRSGGVSFAPAEDLLDGFGGGRDAVELARILEGDVGVFQPVAGDDADDFLPGKILALSLHLEQSGQRSGGSGLAENAFFRAIR